MTTLLSSPDRAASHAETQRVRACLGELPRRADRLAAVRCRQHGGADVGKQSAAPAPAFTVAVLRHDMDEFESRCRAGQVSIRTSRTRVGDKLRSGVEFRSAGWAAPVSLCPGVMALALHFSGQRLTRRLEDDPVRVAELVVAGVDGMGLDMLRAVNETDKQLNAKEFGGGLTASERRLRVWNHRRAQLCTDLAHDLLFHARGGRTTVDREFELLRQERGGAR